MSRESNTVEIHRCDECGATWQGNGRSNHIEWAQLRADEYGKWKGVQVGADFCSPECLRDNIARAIRNRTEKT